MKIDADVAPEKPTTLTVTPQLAGTFEVIGDHYFTLGRGNMKMTVVVE